MKSVDESFGSTDRSPSCAKNSSKRHPIRGVSVFYKVQPTIRESRKQEVEGSPLMSTVVASVVNHDVWGATKKGDGASKHFLVRLVTEEDLLRRV